MRTQRTTIVSLTLTTALAAGAATTPSHAGIVDIGTPDKRAASSSDSFTVDMTSEGDIDWAVWGFQDPDGDPLTAANRKDDGGGSAVNAISELTQIVVDDTENLENWDATWVPFHASYTDGTLSPTSASDQESLLRLGGQGTMELGDGLGLSADADTSTRVLTLYLFARNITGTLTATLSGDGSSDTVDLVNDAQDDGTWEVPITFSADTAGQTLDLTWVIDTDHGNQESIGISGATLAVPEPASLALLGLGGLAMLGGRRRGQALSQ